MQKLDVIALGELLVDFTSGKKSEQGNNMFEANPGGAPCNVLAMLAKLGHKTGFIGKVGNDIFGQELIKRVSAAGIDTKYIYKDDNVNTTLAFIKTLAHGDRDFSFYRNPGADMMLCEDEVVSDYIKQSRVFHHGTLSMTHESVRRATKKSLKIARENNVLVSFDPNIRPPLWESMELCRQQIEYGMKKCDILKISDNEISWFTNEDDYDKAIDFIRYNYSNIKLILLSLGRDGSMAFCKDSAASAAAFTNVKTIETTGAGDSFLGACLHFVLEHGIDNLNDNKLLNDMLVFANAAAAIVTTKKGALCVMPNISEIRKLIDEA